MQEPTPARARISALDGLRGIAALAVVIYHYGYRFPEIYPDEGDPIAAVWIGQFGVQLFFVISGFVIFLSLQDATIRRFATSRFIRLYPIYWVCIAVTTVTVAVFGLPGREVSWSDTLVNLTMLQRYFNVPAVDGAYWTLAAELAFYVQVGALFFIGALRRRHVTTTLYAWLVASVVVLSTDQFVPVGAYRQAVAVLTPGVIWLPLFIAGIAFFLVWDGNRKLPTVLLPVACVAAMALQGSQLTLATVGVFAVFIVSLRTSVVTSLGRAAVYLGEISYVLYLLHQNVGYVMMRGLIAHGVSHVGAAALALVGIVAIAAAVTYFVDIPLRRALRRRLLPARARTMAV